MRSDWDWVPEPYDHQYGASEPISPDLHIDHKAIRVKANAMADILVEARAESADLFNALSSYADEIGRIGLPNPKVKNIGLWFWRALLRDERQHADLAEHHAKAIGRNGSRIVSTAVLISRRTQMSAQRQFLEKSEVVTKDSAGMETRIACSKIYNTPEKRMAKLYVRVSGLDKYCNQQALAGFFLTLTLPPEFHPNPSKGKNSWDGSTPAKGHQVMQGQWRSWQRRFGKAISVRVEEQHWDGCIHWHVLVWIDPEREAELREKLELYFGKAPAAVVLKMDPSKASAGTYLMKYLLKATGPLRHGADQNMLEVAELADAHRATWGGRAIQISDIEGSATIWDEIRRIKFSSDNWAALCGEGRALHSAASINNYCEFLTILNQLNLETDAKRCGIWYQENEKGTKLIKGIYIDTIKINTHEKIWKTREKKKTNEVLKNIKNGESR